MITLVLPRTAGRWRFVTTHSAPLLQEAGSCQPALAKLYWKDKLDTQGKRSVFVSFSYVSVLKKHYF